ALVESLADYAQGRPPNALAPPHRCLPGKEDVRRHGPPALSAWRRCVTPPFRLCEQFVTDLCPPTADGQDTYRGTDETPTGLRAPDGRGTGRAVRADVVHRRARDAQVLSDHAGGAGERPGGGHDLRWVDDRWLQPGPGERCAGHARCQDISAPPLSGGR